MRVLITGGTGFIGSALCREMINNGHEVTVIVRPGSKKKDRIPMGVQIIELGLDRLNELSGNYDLFYHLAWNGSSGNDRNDFDVQYSNIQYTKEAIKAAKRCGCKKIIGAGSQAEYGVVYGMAKEDETVCKPFMMYGAAKLAAYNMGKIVAGQENIKFVWPRIYSIYGPGENDGTLISYLVKSLLESKVPKLSACENMWNYMYIHDCTRVLRKLGEDNKAEGIYNVASDDTRLLRDYVKEICCIVNSNCSLNFGSKIVNLEKTFNLKPDISKLKMVDSTSNTLFSEGIRELVSFNKIEKV